MRIRRSFTKAFKAEAVRLLEQSGKPAAELARELGVPRNRLYKWQAQIRAHGEHKGVKSMLDSCYGNRAPLRPRARGEELTINRDDEDSARS